MAQDLTFEADEGASADPEEPEGTVESGEARDT